MDKILVIDYWSQYTHLITSNLRHKWVYSEIVEAPERFDGTFMAMLRDSDIKGIVLSWGPNSVYEDLLIISKDNKVLNDFINLEVPILGICYWHQLICSSLGWIVHSWKVKEYWLAEIEVIADSKLLKGINTRSVAWMSHWDEVVKLPDWFRTILKTKDCLNAWTENEKKRIYTLQFHPEVKHTEMGDLILNNFIDITWVPRNWSMKRFIEFEINNIASKVNGKKVFLLISWGVDSTVAYFLLKKAIGAENIYPLLIDTGLMRKNEVKNVETMLNNSGVKNLRIEDASDRFFEWLRWIYDPEKKRKIIWELFLSVQRDVLKRIWLNSSDWILWQGTIYPDTIESWGTKHADKIKTHHNRIPEIELLIKEWAVIEPISMLYKDEVRETWTMLWIPDEIINRHPFPGPGLWIRVLCSDWVVEPWFDRQKQEIQDYVWASISILPVLSVGVQWDNRTYRHPCLLNYSDRLLSSAITNRFNSVNRVLLILNWKHWDYTLNNSFIARTRVNLLREIDDLVRKNIDMTWVWQFPIVLIPVSRSWKGESIVLRPVLSDDAMTAKSAEYDYGVLKSLSDLIIKNYWDTIENVFYDVTNKPPWTIEWE